MTTVVAGATDVLVLTTLLPAVALVSSSAAVELVMDGGTLVLNQRFTGAVAKSRVLVACTAFLGTLTLNQLMPLGPTTLVSGWPFTKPGSTITRKLFVALKLALVSVDRKSTRLNSSHRCISYAV